MFGVETCGTSQCYICWSQVRLHHFKRLHIVYGDFAANMWDARLAKLQGSSTHVDVLPLLKCLCMNDRLRFQSAVIKKEDTEAK